MALRWFFQAIIDGMIQGDNGLPTKLEKDRVRMVHVREAEEDRKLGYFKETYNLNGSGGKEYMGYFQLPLHYPRYKKEDYERMEEWKLDLLLKEYGLACNGSLEEKRAYAMGAFLWPDQL